MVAYRRLKTKENFKRLALKVAAVAYERWSLTRGSQCSDLAKSVWYFGKVVAEERWSQTKVRLHLITWCLKGNNGYLISSSAIEFHTDAPYV